MRKSTIAAALPDMPKVTVLTAQVKSESIDNLTFHVETKLLKVTFKNGSTYEYAGVPVATFMKALESDSIGRAFIRLIRNGGFVFAKVS